MVRPKRADVGYSFAVHAELVQDARSALPPELCERRVSRFEQGPRCLGVGEERAGCILRNLVVLVGDREPQRPVCDVGRTEVRAEVLDRRLCFGERTVAYEKRQVLMRCISVSGIELERMTK